MKILVVFTGGTIGCKNENNIIDLDNTSSNKNINDYLLISTYLKSYGDYVSKNKLEFSGIEPLSVLSENMTLNSLEKLIFALKDIDFDEYKGIIICHGSDSLAYTSNILGFLLSGINIPAVIVASNLPIGEKNSNAINNFSNAVCLIVSSCLRGLYSIYMNNNFDSNIYLSTRLVQSAAFDDNFKSFSSEPVGIMKSGNLVFKSNNSVNINNLISVNDKEPLIYNFNGFKKTVIIINPYTGLNYDTINPSDNTCAILHTTYHSFTACTEGDKHSIINFNNRLKSKNIDLYLAPFKNCVKLYASTDKILSNGIKTIDNMSLEAAYAKLLLAYNIFEEKDKIDEFLNLNTYFERIVSNDC